MTVNGFIKQLEMLKPELRNKEILITAPNGLQFTPKIKQQSKTTIDMIDGKVNNMVLTY